MAENTDLKSRKHKEKGLEGLLEGEKTSKEDESSKESTSGKGSTE